jgi:hypothetical protein
MRTTRKFHTIEVVTRTFLIILAHAFKVFISEKSYEIGTNIISFGRTIFEKEFLEMKRFFLPLYLVSSTFISCNWFSTETQLFAVQLGEKWGYIDAAGEQVISPQFQFATPFYEGRALCMDAGGKWGFIDETGRFVISPSFEDCGRFSEGLAPVVKENGRIAYINPSGEVEFEAQRATEGFGFREGMARAAFNGKWGFLDNNGEWAIPPIYYSARDFHEGLAAVGRYDHAKEAVIWGYISQSGAVQIPFQFSMGEDSGVEPGDFHQGLAYASHDGQTWGYINTSGNFEVSPQFDYSSHALKFAGGFAAVKKGDQGGYINPDGAYEVNLQFLNVLPFSENGMAAVQTDDEKWGFIGKDGRIAINPQFEDIETGYFGGVALVQSSGKYGLIDESGKYLANPQFDQVFAPNPETNWSVAADFITGEEMASIVWHQSGGSYFQGMNPQNTLGDVEMREGELDVSTFSENYFQEPNPSLGWHDVLQPQSKHYFFDGQIYEREPIYREVERWNWLFGGYYTDYDLVGYERNIKRERSLTGSYLTWDVPSSKTEDALTVVASLLESATSRYGGERLFEDQIQNNPEKGRHLLLSENGLVVIDYETVEEEVVGDEKLPKRLRFLVGLFNPNFQSDLNELAESLADDYL